jgi:hypothetical protein
VHRTTFRLRPRRQAFTKAVLAAFPPLLFDPLAARTHAGLRAGLAAAGTDNGERPDRRCIRAGRKTATANTRHIDRIPGLNVTSTPHSPPKAPRNRRSRRSGVHADIHSGAVCAGSNPAGGAFSKL